jgi:hydroxymethylpyrimidine/phosphomethylpyrimidine kinase
MVDRFDDGRGLVEFAHPRLPVSAHGTGCTLASAVAANLCRGMDLRDACSAATDYVHGALRHGYRPGRGEVSVLDHFWMSARGNAGTARNRRSSSRSCGRRCAPAIPWRRCGPTRWPA